MNKLVQVFEHSQLPVGDKLKEVHFRRLVKYNERHGNVFFAVGHNRIYFRNYVGVIQVGSLTIEILPKADNSSNNDQTTKDKWQRALVEMIRKSGLIRLTSLTDAMLSTHSARLLDIFFKSFLSEVEQLAHHGLVRKYRKNQDNLTTLKGRLLFQKQITLNLVRRERFYTEHVHYDRNNPFNQILGTALDILILTSSNPHLTAQARNLALSFEDIDRIKASEITFSRLNYTRNTERYRRAIQLARLIILNYCPDVRSGGEDVLAILFDMNNLFERYVYAQLKRAEAMNSEQNVSFRAQVQQPFWKTDRVRKHIRPDIIAEIGQGHDQKRVVIDTKWKIPRDGKPADTDLHQMYAYNIQFGAKQSLLLYPRTSSTCDIQGCFEQPVHFSEIGNNSCGMCFVELFDQDAKLLGERMGNEIIDRLRHI